jgi:predicted Zn-dependent protease
MNKSSVVKIWSILLLFLFLSLVVACGGGGGSGGSSSGVSGTYVERVAHYKAAYGKSDEWEDWMIANKARYEATFAASSAKPATITISFQYETAPINYNPAWINEEEHMNVLATMAEGAYPGYNFNIVFEGNTNTSYANIIAGIAANPSYSLGKDVYLYYETIFNHEFGHTMHLPHHYDSIGDMGNGLHMPPGDTKCIMDRTSTMYCSACRTALGIPLDISDTTDMDTATNDILGRYPY